MMTEKKLCAATTREGAPCGNKTLKDSDYCYIKSHQALAAEDEPQEVVVEPKTVVKPTVCGHVNKHSLGPDGKPDNLSCTLDPGHSGPHAAEHYEVHYFKAEHRKGGRVLRPKRDYEGPVLRHWADEAGTPPDQIEPNNTELESIRMLRKAGLSVEQIKAALSIP
jgi:hypothetical protein